MKWDYLESVDMYYTVVNNQTLTIQPSTWGYSTVLANGEVLQDVELEDAKLAHEQIFKNSRQIKPRKFRKVRWKLF